MRVLKVNFIILILIFYLSPLICTSYGAEENDLWLLVSSYEDVGITVQDLAFFLATHGYDARPEKSYVTVILSSGEVYLTPNGASPRLADLWAIPPTPTGLIMLIPEESIQKDVKYEESKNKKFFKTLSRYVLFPVTPLGMCYDGSQHLGETYSSFGYNVKYMYDPSQFDWQGHLWVLVEDDEQPDYWLAVDNYYGIMTQNEYYYVAPYSFEEFEYLDSINPKWRLL